MDFPTSSRVHERTASGSSGLAADEAQRVREPSPRRRTEEACLTVRWAADGTATASGLTSYAFSHGVLTASWQYVNGVLSVHSDRYGMLPLYIFQEPGRTVVATSLAAVMRAVMPLALDEDAIASFLRLGAFLGDDTPFQGVRRVAPGTVLVCDQSGCRASGGWPVVAPTRLGPDAAAAAYRELFHEALRSVPVDPERSVVLLSGGRDSRHILLGLHAIGQTPANALTVQTDPFDGRNNTEIAAALAASCGVPHTVVPLPATRWEAELAKDALTDSACLEHWWMMAARDWLKGRDAVVYDGLAGDILSESKFLTRERAEWFDRGDFDSIADDLMSPESAVRGMLASREIARFGRERAHARLVQEMRRAADAPSPAVAFRLSQRTRRGIAPSSFALLGSAATVVTPFLYPPLHDMLAGLDVGVILATGFHSRVIAAAYPEQAHIPYDRYSAAAVATGQLFGQVHGPLTSPRLRSSIVRPLRSESGWRTRLLLQALRGQRGSVYGLLMHGAWIASLDRLADTSR